MMGVNVAVIFLVVSIFMALQVSTALMLRSARKSGLAISWLRHLDANEQGDIREICSEVNVARFSAYHTNASSAAAERIVGGEMAFVGQFPHAAVVFIVFKNERLGYRPFCGATLVSRRHLITAAQCIRSTELISDYLEGITFRVAVGGVCLMKSDRSEERCPRGDMYEAQVELVVKEFYVNTRADAGSYLRRERDIAIIQLREPLPDYLFDNVGMGEDRTRIACLPSDATSPLPPRLTLAGWGGRKPTEDPYGPPTHHLRYIHGSSKAADDFDGIPHCHPPALGREALPVSDVCLFGLDLPAKHRFSTVGGIGSGVVNTRTIPNTLYGVHAATASTNKLYEYGISMSVAYHLGDWCYYISLCASKAHLPVPRLLLSSAYITVPRKDLPPIPPFRMVNDAEVADHAEHCSSLLNMTTPPAFKWVAAVTIDHGEEHRVCTATLITSSHLVTTRGCLLGHLKSATTKRAAIKVRVAIKIEGGELWSLQPEFIAWCHLSVGYQERVYTNPTGLRLSIPPYPPDSELAIVQLSEADAKRLQGLIGDAYNVDAAVKPACLEHVVPYDDFGRPAHGSGSPAIGYTWSSDGAVENYPVTMRGQFGNQAKLGANEINIRHWSGFQSDGLPSDILLAEEDKDAGKGSPIAHRHHADGFVVKRGHRVLGLLVGGGAEEATKMGDAGGKGQMQPPLRYMHLWDYSGVFCTFLNLNCFASYNASMRYDTSYIDNRIAFFDRFIYPE